MIVVKNIAEIREKVKAFRKNNFVIGLIPTMGALHVGHESLIKRAKEECDAVIVSIFVNPAQFCPGEDFNKYPRQFKADKEICSRLGVSLIFAPTAEEMRSAGALTEVVPPSEFQDKLCGSSRKGHFNGVATVVLKFFNIIIPDKAYFGQKDAQQLAIIKKMIQDLDLNVEITGCPTVRETDGLACSSRNKYLDEESREKAVSINRAIERTRELYNAGEDSALSVIKEAKKILHLDLEIEYFKAVDMETFEYTEKIRKNTLIAVAVRLDGLRLIDNLII